MPAEVRKIIFDAKDLHKAAVTYCIRKNIRLPNARVQSVTVDPNSKEFVTLHFMRDDLEGTDWDSRISFNRDQTGAALILLCRSCRIPTPRGGAKSLEPEGDGLAMVIRVDHRVAPKAAGA